MRAALLARLLERYRTVLLAVVGLGGMRCAGVVLRALVILFSSRVFTGRGGVGVNVQLNIILPTFLRKFRSTVYRQRALLILDVRFVLAGARTFCSRLNVVINAGRWVARRALVSTRVSRRGASRLLRGGLDRTRRNFFRQRV